MNKSESIGELAKALCIVQGKLKPAIKDATNPHFKKSYADLNSVWDSCRQLLAENGLSVVQLNQVADNGVIVETVLLHKSGEWIGGEIFLPLAKQDPQGVGSAMTYGRRYGLSAMVGIVADADDDANAAQPPYPQQRPSQPTRSNVQQMPYNNQPKAAPASQAISAQEAGKRLVDINAVSKTKEGYVIVAGNGSHLVQKIEGKVGCNCDAFIDSTDPEYQCAHIFAAFEYATRQKELDTKAEREQAR